jgi:hypothetical protein
MPKSARRKPKQPQGRPPLPTARAARTSFPAPRSASVDPGDELRELAGDGELDDEPDEDQPPAKANAPVGSVRPSTLRRARVPDLLQDIGAAQVAARRAELNLRKRVRAARDHGANWEDIGLVLGMSRQGAAKRFG